MTYYSVLDVTPTNTDWVADYVGPTTALVSKHGGRYLSRTASHECMEGSGEVGLRVIIEWPSREAAVAFIEDPEYAPHLAARTEGSVSNHFLIEGKDDLT